MVASTNTINRLYQTLRKHMNCQQINAMLIDLAMIPGNKSFRDTVQGIQAIHREHQLAMQRKRDEAQEQD